MSNALVTDRHIVIFGQHKFSPAFENETCFFIRFLLLQQQNQNVSILTRGSLILNYIPYLYFTRNHMRGLSIKSTRGFLSLYYDRWINYDNFCWKLCHIFWELVVLYTTSINSVNYQPVTKKGINHVHLFAGITIVISRPPD